MRIRDDFTLREHVSFEDAPWVSSPEAGVERRMLERTGGEIARATSIVRYAAGSAFFEHGHELGEEFVVLEGTFSDEHGDYPTGTYVRNPPGSRHRPSSRDGCTIFVKLRQFDPHDGRRCVLPIDVPGGGGSGSTLTLIHAFGTERVSLVRLVPGATLDLAPSDGVELFVLRGSMDAGEVHCRRWSWLRAPRSIDPVRSASGCVFWLKQGHLPSPLRAATSRGAA